MIVRLKKQPKTKPFVSSYRIDPDTFFTSTVRAVKSKLEAKTASRRAYGLAVIRGRG